MLYYVSRFLRWLRDWIGGLFGGVYLIGLYALTVFAVVGSLSTIQVQDEAADRYEIVNFNQVTDAETRMVARIESVEFRVANQDQYSRDLTERSEVIRQLADELDLRFYGSAGASFERYLTASESFREAQVSCQGGSGGTCQLLRTYAEVTERIEAYPGSQQEQEFLAVRAAADDEIRAIREAEPLAPYFHTVRFFAAIPSYQFMLEMPRQVLVMILTMAMGALGSVITMTWSFVRRDSGLTLRRFLILPFVGSMSAFIILVFLKAGQLTLSSGDGVDTLSPFVLSFVGIISGLLSERAYSRMSEIGTQFFTEAEDQPRWGLDLEKRIKSARIDPGTVSAYLGVSRTEAEDIISESAPATLMQQRLMSALLRQPVRALFTDQPPVRA